MGLSVGRSVHAGVPVLHLSQELDSATASELDAVLTTILGETDSLIVDLKGVTYVSSAPLGLLIQANSRMRARRGVLVLASPQRDVRRIFHIAGLDDLMMVCDGLDEAADYVVLVGRRGGGQGRPRS